MHTHTFVPDAPPHDAPPPPTELMTDITLEELVVYFPSHVLCWPGLALLLLRTKWNQLFARVTKYINEARGTKREANTRKHVFRNSCRLKVKNTIKEAVSPDYSLTRHGNFFTNFVTAELQQEVL